MENAACASAVLHFPSPGGDLGRTGWKSEQPQGCSKWGWGWMWLTNTYEGEKQKRTLYVLSWSLPESSICIFMLQDFSAICHMRNFLAKKGTGCLGDVQEQTSSFGEECRYSFHRPIPNIFFNAGSTFRFVAVLITPSPTPEAEIIIRMYVHAHIYLRMYQHWY